MEKFNIFFSHSSKDKDLLLPLKQKVLEITGNTVQIFMSSDGQSIRFGKNWVHEIERALETAKLMFTFISPNSVNSNWIYFEAGYAYSKGINVVPTAINGLLMENIKAPLGLLQGFNIKNHSGLNNIIALINSECQFSHKESFSENDYSTIFTGISPDSLAEVETYINEIKFEASAFEGWEEVIRSIFEKRGLPLQTAQIRSEFNGHGVTIKEKSEGNPGETVVEFSCDPMMWVTNQAIIDDFLLSKKGSKSFELTVVFSPLVQEIKPFSKITSRIFNSEIKLSKNEKLSYKNCELGISHYIHMAIRGVRTVKRGASYLTLNGENIAVSSLEIFKLVGFLVDKEIIFLEYTES